MAANINLLVMPRSEVGCDFLYYVQAFRNVLSGICIRESQMALSQASERGPSSTYDPVIQYPQCELLRCHLLAESWEDVECAVHLGRREGWDSCQLLHCDLSPLPEFLDHGRSELVL